MLKWFLLVLTLTGTAALGQQNTEALSSAHNSLSFGGSTSSPSVGGSTTAPCMISNGVSVGLPSVMGFGFNATSVEESCLLMAEVEFLIKVLKLPKGPHRDLSLYHICSRSDRMRKTLVDMGYCIMKD